MDKKDREILKILAKDARISYQELGNQLGISRVAALKRVRKLEREGIIRGYNTAIFREDEITLLIDIVTTPEAFAGGAPEDSQGCAGGKGTGRSQ